MVKASGIYYFHKDHLSSSSLITDESGKIVQETGYLPYGMQRGYSDITLSSYKFTDQEQDSETGLYNYDARLYDPAIGSFITPDSIIPGIYNPLAVNHYAYCLYNPLRFIDPDGHITHDFAGFGNSFDYSAREWRSPGNPKFNAELPEESALKNLIADYNPAVSALDTIVAGIEGDFQGVVLNAAVTVGGRLFRPFKQFGLKGIKATKRLLPGVKFPKGVGKKVAQHGSEWGLNPAKAADRTKFQNIVQGVVRRYDQVKQGAWHPKVSGGGKDFIFYRQGSNVVVTKPNGSFVTIMKDAANNTWFKNAKNLSHGMGVGK